MSLEFRSLVYYYKMALHRRYHCTCFISPASFARISCNSQFVSIHWWATAKWFCMQMSVYTGILVANNCWINVMAQIEILVIPVEMKKYYCIPSYFMCSLIMKSKGDGFRSFFAFSLAPLVAGGFLSENVHQNRKFMRRKLLRFPSGFELVPLIQRPDSRRLLFFVPSFVAILFLPSLRMLYWHEAFDEQPFF